MALTNDDLQSIASLLQPINNRLDSMDIRLEKLESEMSSMKIGQMELKKEVREVRDKVSDTYNLALDAWGQSTENRTWLESEHKVIIS